VCPAWKIIRRARNFYADRRVIEIVAAFLVAIKPKIGAPIVAAWLVGIIVNLLLLGTYFDIALRDFGLFLGALALSRLAVLFDQANGEVTKPA
jgi:hypothetical protein